VPGAKSNDSSSNFMQAFFKDVELVKQNILGTHSLTYSLTHSPTHSLTHLLVIQTSTRRISDINQQIILATSSEKEQDLSTDLGPTISETNKKAALTKALLQKLREETEKNKASSNCKQSEIRIRYSLTHPLTHSLTHSPNHLLTYSQGKIWVIH
jgi:hypothetical protein